MYDSETGLYYLGSRYYDPGVGRFISADALITSKQGFSGYCLFAYCNNNPVNSTDSKGKWTKGISFSFNFTAFTGVSYSIGWFWDDKGNTEWQSSYCNEIDDGQTKMYGYMDAGVGFTFQWTEADTIYDLYGPSLIIGGSAGNALYGGLDMVYLGEYNVHDTQKQPDGYQITVGYGCGMDVHIMKTKTVSGWNGFTNGISIFYRLFKKRNDHMGKGGAIRNNTRFCSLID